MPPSTSKTWAAGCKENRHGDSRWHPGVGRVIDRLTSTLAAALRVFRRRCGGRRVRTSHPRGQVAAVVGVGIPLRPEAVTWLAHASDSEKVGRNAEPGYLTFTRRTASFNTEQAAG